MLARMQGNRARYRDVELDNSDTMFARNRYDFLPMKGRRTIGYYLRGYYSE